MTAFYEWFSIRMRDINRPKPTVEEAFAAGRQSFKDEAIQMVNSCLDRDPSLTVLKKAIKEKPI